jgi:tripartite-type tricarboxylate transporter receptor subunit TctC
MRAMSRFVTATAVLAAVLSVGFGVAGPASADAVEDFYRGKQMTLVIGTGPGGAYDIHGRLIGRHIFRHIPGAPKSVIQNIPGAGSIQAGNFVYGVAPQDGSVLGNILNTVPLVQILGQATTQFDAAKFQWIGNMTQESSIVVAWHTSGIKTVDDAKQGEVLMGATSPGTLGGMFPKIINQIAGTKFRVITGYKEAVAIDLAMQRGEVQGRAGESWFGDKGSYGEWRREGKINILVQIGPKKAKELIDVPLLTEVARDDNGRKLAELFTSPSIVGKPTVVGPNVPKDRVEALRKAYAETMTDPAFLEDADKIGLAPNPIGGADLEAAVKRIFATPDNLVAMARGAIE